jgi:hypothetical protein
MASLELFNATTDKLMATFPVWRRGFQTSYITDDDPKQLVLRMSTNELGDVKAMGFQFSSVGKLTGRSGELESFDKLILRAKTTNPAPMKAKVVLSFADGSSVSADAILTDTWKDVQIPLNKFVADAAMLLPRPYPDFQPLLFKSSAPAGKFRLYDLEKVEVTLGSDLTLSERKHPYCLDIKSILLQKK